MDPINFTLGFAVGCLFTLALVGALAFRFMAPYIKQAQRRDLDK